MPQTASGGIKNPTEGNFMRATELFPGLICYVIASGGSVQENGQKVRVIEAGISQKFSTRKDSSKIVHVDIDEDGTLRDHMYENTEYNQRWHPEDIGKPRVIIVKNKCLVSLREGDQQVEDARKQREERERVQELMRSARDEMAVLLVQHGIDGDDVRVNARYDREADAAEVTSVNISGESVERLIQVFRDFEGA
jgi:hypothetical protein